MAGDTAAATTAHFKLINPRLLNRNAQEDKADARKLKVKILALRAKCKPESTLSVPWSIDHRTDSGFQRSTLRRTRSTVLAAVIFSRFTPAV